MFRLKWFIISWLSLLVMSANAQQPKRYSFNHYSSASGLSSNEVLDIAQDEDGFIWIATNNGLQRFDGVRFITFRSQKNNPASLKSNVISQLLPDNKKNLWVQCGGLTAGVFNTRNFTFRETPIKPSQEMWLYSDKVMTKDESGNMFMVLWNNELLQYDTAKNAFLPATEFMGKAAGWRITGFCQLPGSSRYLLGTQKGIVIYDKKSKEFIYPGEAGNDEFAKKIGKITGASNFLVDNRGRIWFDSWEPGSSVIYAFDTKNNSFVFPQNYYSFQPQLNAYHEVRGVLQQKNGEIWVKGLNVLAKFLEKERTFQLVYNGYENEQSISYSRVNKLMEDNEDNIWVATDHDGLFRFNPQEQFFTNVRHINRATGRPADGSMMSFVMTKNHEILAGAWENGLYRFDRNFNMLPLAMPGIEKYGIPAIWSMVASADSHTIWMGAQPGVWKWDQRTNGLQFFNPSLLNNRTIRQVAEDRAGNLWLGTQSIGVFKWDRKKGQVEFENGLSKVADIPPTMVLKISVDRDGYVWVCTSSYGAYMLDPATAKAVSHFGSGEPEERKLPWDGVAAALDYDDSTTLIASNSICVYNRRQKRITRTISLPESFAGAIMAVERDRQGYLWISTTSGIYRLNISNKIFIRFDRVDGIANDRFIMAASYVLPDGKMLFGADNQFISFDPAGVRFKNLAPPVKITGFKLMNEPLMVDSLLRRGKIELGHKDNSVSIEFSGLSYNGAFIIRYKLEGLDKEWKVADKNYEAIYSYLPPGTYTFMARSEDAEGRPGNEITRLIIRINPPFWKTWWFFCVLALAIAAVFYWLDQQRLNKLVALQNVRTEIAANLHEDVNKTLNNINVLSEMARIKADRDIERSKEYIDQISAKSHNMIIAMDDILWSIDPKNDSMQKSLLRMMEFADAMKNRFGANIELALDKKVRSLELDMKTRHEVFTIFKEALRMIVQYSSGRDTLVHIDLFRTKLSLKLQDATANLDKNTAEVDLCIREMNERAGMIGAELDVQYDKNGVAVILLVPVR